jgi:CRISPR/Cas system-associated endoribonuclease Cas2
LGIAEAMALRKSINEQMELEENDSIRWYPLCAWCEERARNLGISEPADRGDYYLV